MGVQIAEAAKILNTSKEAIRQRIRRGTLTGEKLDGVWYVHMDVPPDSQGSSPASVQDANSTMYSEVVQGAHRARIEDLLHQVDSLQDQLKVKDEQLRTKDEQMARQSEHLQTVNMTLLEWSRRLPEPKAIEGSILEAETVGTTADVVHMDKPADARSFWKKLFGMK